MTMYRKTQAPQTLGFMPKKMAGKPVLAPSYLSTADIVKALGRCSAHGGTVLLVNVDGPVAGPVFAALAGTALSLVALGAKAPLGAQWYVNANEHLIVGGWDCGHALRVYGCYKGSGSSWAPVLGWNQPVPQGAYHSSTLAEGPETLGALGDDPVSQAVLAYVQQYASSVPGLPAVGTPDATALINIATTLLRSGIAGTTPTPDVLYDPSWQNWFLHAAQAAAAWVGTYGNGQTPGPVQAIPGVDLGQVSQVAMQLGNALLALTKTWPQGAPPLPAPPAGVDAGQWLQAIISGASLLLTNLLPTTIGAGQMPDAATAIQAMLAAASILRQYVPGATPITTPGTPPPVTNCGTPGYVVDPATGNCVPSGNQPPHIGPIPGPCPDGSQPGSNGVCPGSLGLPSPVPNKGGTAATKAAGASDNSVAWVVGGGLAAVALAGLAFSMKRRRKAA